MELKAEVTREFEFNQKYAQPRVNTTPYISSASAVGSRLKSTLLSFLAR